MEIGPSSHEFVTPRVRAEVYNPSVTPWKSIRDQIMRIEEEAFPDFEACEEVLKPDFEHPDNVVILLRDFKNNIVGYSYAEPISHLNPERIAEDSDTAYVSSTAILPEHQKKGYLKPLLETLNGKVIEKGFSFLERHARIDEGYADTLGRLYSDRIIAQKDVYDPDIDENKRFFRMKL